MLQKNVRRSVDWTMWWPARVKFGFFFNRSAGEDETSEGNPENSKCDAVDVAPSVSAPEDEAAAEPAPENEAAAEPTTAEPTTAEPTTAKPTTAEPTTAKPTTAEPTTAKPTTAEPTTAKPTTAEPTTAEPARRVQAVQELDLTLDNPTDRALFQLGTLPTKLRTTIIYYGPCCPKGQLLSAARMTTDTFSLRKKHYHYILGQWK